MLVVVLGIDPKDALKMACVDDEQMIETLGSDGPDEALRVSIRVRSPKRNHENLG